jgi:exodeoxyribonuclease VII small subunit
MEKKSMKYEEAMAQLEDIVRKLENEELGLDEMGRQLKTAQKLIKLCKARLTETDEEIQKLLMLND